MEHQSNMIAAMAVAQSTFNDPEDMISRVELMVEGVTSQNRLPRDIVRQEELTYPADEVNQITNPALDALRKVYATINPTDRVEVLVYSDNNRLRHAFVDGAYDYDRRAFTIVSKVEEAYNRMCNQVDAYADAIGTPRLNQMEKDVTEVIYDDKIVRHVLTGE